MGGIWTTRHTGTNVVLDDTPHRHKCHPEGWSCPVGPTPCGVKVTGVGQFIIRDPTRRNRG